MSWAACGTRLVAKVVSGGTASCADRCVERDGSICCFFEPGAPCGVGGCSGGIVLARFGPDRLAGAVDSTARGCARVRAVLVTATARRRSPTGRGGSDSRSRTVPSVRTHAMVVRNIGQGE